MYSAALCLYDDVHPDDDGGEFLCPAKSSPGVFTKHAHPADCRQYFLCIGTDHPVP
jgi:hypothetical protein